MSSELRPYSLSIFVMFIRILLTGELDMDPLLPTLSIVDTSVPQDRQQCFLKASKDAKTLASRNRCFERNTSQDKKTACEEGNI